MNNELQSSKYCVATQRLVYLVSLTVLLGPFPNLSAQRQHILPCNTFAVKGLIPTKNPIRWPETKLGYWLYVDGFEQVCYEGSQNTNRRNINNWTLGYQYGVSLPSSYNVDQRSFPLVVFLHGGSTGLPGGQNPLSDAFYIPDDDPYVLAIPSKKEEDWDAQKTLDVITDIKAKLRIDSSRVYLTGLSMGGRGTFIVAAEIPRQFAAIMPLSPHHGPYSYIHLAPKISDIPIWMSHGDKDTISSYEMALEMKDELQELGAEITFNTITGGRHCCWREIYSNPQVIRWLLSRKKIASVNNIEEKSWGHIKNYK